MANKRRYEIGVGILLLAALFVAGFMALRIGAFSGLSGKVHVSVPIEDAAGLTKGAVVSVAGVEVGKIERMEVAGDVAMVGLALDPDVELRSDAEVRIRSRSVLGERYLEMLPRTDTAPLLQDGDVLPRVSRQTEIDELVNTLGPVLASVDPELLGRALEHLARALEEDPQRLERMLDNADVLLANLADASEDLPDLVESGKKSSDALGDAARAIEHTADNANATLQGADAAIAKVGDAADSIDGAAESVGEAAAHADESLDTLDDAGEDLAAILDALEKLDDRDLERLLLDEGIRIRLFNQRRRLENKDRSK